MIVKKFKKLVHWLAIVTIALPINLISVSSAKAATTVLINEVFVNGTNKWVELINTTGTAIPVDGYKIFDGTSSKTIKNGVSIPANGLVVIDDSYLTSGVLSFTDTAGVVILYDSGDVELSRVEYGGTTGLNPDDPNKSLIYNSGWSVSSTPSKGWFNIGTTLAQLDAQIEVGGIVTNISEMTNPSESIGLSFEKTGYGKIVYLSKANLTDKNTKEILENLGMKLSMSQWSIAFDVSTADQLKALGAIITMYGLDTLYGITQPKNIIVKDDSVDRNVISPSSSSYPNPSISSYSNGALVFSADHFTQFDIGASVISVSSTFENGSYKTGQVIPITITFDRLVTVVDSPRLKLETGSTDKYATYDTGTGTTTLVFNYTVESGDQSSDLDYHSSTALELNGGTIKDSNNNNADLTLPTPGQSNSLGSSKNILVDTTNPTNLIVGDDVYTNINTNNVDKDVTFDSQIAGLKEVTWEKKDGPVDGNATIVKNIDDTNTTSKRNLLADKDGVYTIEVKVTDKANNFSTGQFTLTRDTTKPTPTITSISDLYNLSPVEVTVKFDEIVVGFTKEDLTVTNGIATELSSDDSKTFTAKITPTLEGEVTVTLESDKVQDQAGNLNNASGSILSFGYDKTAPTGTLLINSDKEVTNEKDVNLTIAGTDSLNGIEKMKISQELVTASTIDQSVKGDWIDFATAKTFTLTTDKDGNYTVYMQLKDKAGNISSIISDTIFYSSSFINNDVSNPTVDTVNSTDRVIDQIKDNGLYLEVTNKTTGDANIVIGEYEGTPMMGKTFEIKTDNDSVFPIALKFYYTQADLTNAGITDETKIVGIYYYDSATDTWGLYSDTGVYTSNTTIDGIEYQGYVWANLDHLTPLAYGADQTAPKPPANFQVTIVNKSEVKLSWNKVDEAEKYTIRYKKNAIGQEFTYVSIDKINTSTSVINLNGATEYVFEIASVDKYNNYSDYSSQIVTTKNAVAKGLVKTKELVKTKTSFVEVVQAEEEGKGEVKATTDESKDEGKEESRALVTIIILLIALAAGVGGYYGYEYWMLNNQKKTTRKNGKKSGRW